MGVHFAQAVQQVHEHVPHEPFRHLILTKLDLLLQRAAALIAHHHIDGFVGAEEVEHSHNVRMVDLGERAAFLEKAFHSISERGQVFRRTCAHDVAFGAQHQRCRQVFLDRHRGAGVVECAINDREATTADLAIDSIVEQLVTGGKCLIGDAHGPAAKAALDLRVKWISSTFSATPAIK